MIWNKTTALVKIYLPFISLMKCVSDFLKQEKKGEGGKQRFNKFKNLEFIK